MNIWIDKIISLVLLFLTIPLWPILYLSVKLTSRGDFIFKQKRAGLNKKPFTMYKIRTMVVNAENLKKKYAHLNEAERPVFKIRNDPRYTKIGKILSHTAIDELPQLINILKGEMAIVGPRPLPLSEAKRIPNKYSRRFLILPGMTSPWIISGAHQLTFKQWMESDVDYIKKKSSIFDIKILLKTLLILFKNS